MSEINKKAQQIINRIEKATLNPILNKKEVELAFRRQYKLLGVDFPKEVIWRDDLVLGFEYSAKVARDAARDAAWGAARDAARGAAWDAAWDAARDAAWDAARDAAWDAARGAARGAARDAARGAAWDAARDAARGAAWGAAWDAARDAAWGAAAINTNLKDKATKKYIAIETETLKALENGLAWFFPMKDKLILVPLPQFSLDEKNRLHSSTKPAIDWKNGKKFYFLYGIRFEYKLWKSVTSKKPNLKTIFSIDNMEQRMAGLKLVGVEKLLETKNAKRISKSKRNNELYLIKDIFSQDAYFLKYTCPSTGRVYVSGIDPEVGINKDADQCMAWKFNLTKEEYLDLEIES